MPSPGMNCITWEFSGRATFEKPYTSNAFRYSTLSIVMSAHSADITMDKVGLNR